MKNPTASRMAAYSRRPYCAGIRTWRASLAFASGLMLALPLTVSSADLANASAKETKAKVKSVDGSATTTIMSINDRLEIEAVQTGQLTHFGKFTGKLNYVATYVATPSATGYHIKGNGILTNKKGESLFVDVTIEEMGKDYPFIATGALTVTGGTGDYAGASGSIGLTGYDEASYTDTFQLAGFLVTTK